MFIYNLTFNIAESIEEKWLHWLQYEQIPQWLELAVFTKALLTKVLVKEPMGGITYSVQLTAIGRKELDAYLKNEHKKFITSVDRFKGNYVYFATELEMINHYDE